MAPFSPPLLALGLGAALVAGGAVRAAEPLVVEPYRPGPAAAAAAPWLQCQGCDLRGADLRGLVLSGMDLRQADLRGADLRTADLRGAGIYMTQLAEAITDALTLLPAESTHRA